MKITRILLIIAMAFGMAANASAQTPAPPPWRFRGPPPPWMRDLPPAPPGGIPGQMKPGEVEHYPYQGPLKVSKMKLLAPGVGWALTYMGGTRLFWTTDNGANWKNITPPFPRGWNWNISDVFFVDASSGWVLFSRSHEPTAEFAMASTTDAGATWSEWKVVMPPDEGILDPSGQLFFADDRHGWMVVDVQTSSAFHSGTLLLTSDGGRTWRDAPDDPSGQGPILLVTPKEGWMAGGAEDEDLYVTRDGAKTWHKVPLPAPKEIYPAIYPTAGVPVFKDRKHGFVTVTFSGGNGDKSAAVLFKTGDGGRTWKSDRILKNLDESSIGNRVPSTVAGSTWILPRTLMQKAPAITELRAGEQVSVKFAGMYSGHFVDSDPSFVTPEEGWIKTYEGRLLSTADGGAAWTDITPGAPPREIHPQGGELPKEVPVSAPGLAGSSKFVPAGSPTPTASATPSSSATPNSTATPTTTPTPTGGLNPKISERLGFEQYYVANQDDMLTWWNKSPYYDVGFYLNHAVNHGFDEKLTTTWINNVSSVGWGLWPIWVGSQSPCACKYGAGTFPKCKRGTYKRKMSRIPSFAAAQGFREALDTVLQLAGCGKMIAFRSAPR
ncbi:MAG: hypothetical protein ACREQI_08405 [Candidatus Binataceae bacterium]